MFQSTPGCCAFQHLLIETGVDAMYANLSGRFHSRSFIVSPKGYINSSKYIDLGVGNCIYFNDGKVSTSPSEYGLSPIKDDLWKEINSGDVWFSTVPKENSVRLVLLDPINGSILHLSQNNIKNVSTLPRSNFYTINDGVDENIFSKLLTIYMVRGKIPLFGEIKKNFLTDEYLKSDGLDPETLVPLKKYSYKSDKLYAVRRVLHKPLLDKGFYMNTEPSNFSTNLGIARDKYSRMFVKGGIFRPNCVVVDIKGVGLIEIY